MAVDFGRGTFQGFVQTKIQTGYERSDNYYREQFYWFLCKKKKSHKLMNKGVESF